MRFSPFLVCAFLLIINTGLKAQTKVQFYTNYGDFTVRLYDSIVPITAGNFLDLTEQKYYDNTIFHRVIDDFMIQGGDPTGTGSGGPGYTIEDEFDSSLSNIQKTISMANTGPNTGGSQFFINLVNNTYLDFDKPPYSSKHPVFGIVVDSFEVVQRIGKVSTSISDRPHKEVVIDSIRVHPELCACPAYFDLARAIIYPNPTHSQSTLATEIPADELISIRCINEFGNTLWKQELALKEGQQYIDLSSLNTGSAPGLYFIEIQGDTYGVERIKFVVN